MILYLGTLCKVCLDDIHLPGTAHRLLIAGIAAEILFGGS